MGTWTIRIISEHGNIEFHFTKDCFLHTINEWQQFYSGHIFNWYTFTFFQLEMERDHIFDGFEITFMLLGLGLRFRINFPEGEGYKEIHRRMDEVKARSKKDL